MNRTDLDATPDQRANAKFRVLGVNVDAVQIPEVIARMESWIAERGASHFIAVTGMHGVTEAQRDPGFKRILNGADLAVPDGMPLVWLARRRGIQLERRVYGPELMTDFCGQTVAKSYRHFLYGGDPVVAGHLATVLQERFPGILIAGVYSPPFRPLTEAEETEITNRLNHNSIDVLWVALGCPRQERWMHVHRDKLRVPVMVGVGAAFDFIAGAKKQAPRWMRECGLEWLFRLLQEPRRLWRRYLVYGSEFAFRVILEQLGLHRPD
ncbi:MAG TPA: WecB/TagA/CpsF family glycosyltransferase [Candidatus Acidoferrum sp.]|jgi:N-acetylglucosaminyldiphosphoundecaprenol N-acetyl-beta-D-mannosaminyltransferase|nr:WecB/TagA/CpsF family glycosyltransferase [Candidatus Acidoferrum sp.]